MTLIEVDRIQGASFSFPWLWRVSYRHTFSFSIVSRSRRQVCFILFLAVKAYPPQVIPYVQGLWLS